MHTDTNARFTCDSPHPLLERDALTAAERAELLEAYVTRGRALRLDGDRGLIDSHRRREAHGGQFFTPTRLVRLLGQALGLVHHPSWNAIPAEERELPATGALVDPAGCGNGRMFQIAPPGWTCHGADLDPLACRAARLIYPQAEVLDTSLIAFEKPPHLRFSVALINPPFSLTLCREAPLELKCAGWGVWGRGTSVQSHLAAVELATSMAPVVGAVLPTSMLAAGDLDRVLKDAERWRGPSVQLRLDLPPDAFASEGTEWPCSLVVLADLSTEPVVRSCDDWSAVDAALVDWIEAQCSTSNSYRQNVIDLLRHEETATPSLAACLRRDRAPPRRATSSTIVAGESPPTVRLALGGRGHVIRLKPNGPLAAHAVEEMRLMLGWITSPGFRPQGRLEWDCDLVRNAGRARDAVAAVADALRATGVAVAVDRQLHRFAERTDRRTALEMSDFRQAVRDGDAWVERGYDPLADPSHPAHELARTRFRLFHDRAEAIAEGLMCNRWHNASRRHTRVHWPAFPVYAFSRQDIARALTHRACVYSAKQGLAKTRFGIGAVLASGVTRAVWVLETRLVNEFRRELKKVGLLGHYHFIETKEDLRRLRAFNVITYATLRKSINPSSKERPADRWGPGKTFAAALARRRLFVIVDEAHKLSNPTTKQSVAVRHLCNRARRVLLLTGTAIRNYPRNILGLAAAGWGDGSSMNIYGYRRPIQGGYRVTTPSGQSRQRNELVKGVARFVDEFVDVVWYTPEFEQTAATGMKSREIPRVKNPALWESFIRPKIIRRLPDEPEVRACISTPKAEPVFAAVPPTPDHFAYYKRVLDRFADLWRKRLAREQAGGKRENSAAHILPELDALRFASTVPILRHPWADADSRLRYDTTTPTALMQAALEQIAAWVAAGDRVIIGAEKPDALRWLRDLLADLPTYVPDAEPVDALLAHDANIERRNRLIDRARDDESVSVLLLSVGMGKEGLNLASFNRLGTIDLGWVPSDLDQYRHRILRPDQTRDTTIVHWFHKGMVDAYMAQLCQAKSDAIENAIDGQRTTFDYSQWKDYRTFALEMLREEGYAFAAAALERLAA